jgi:hypothetical protein
MWRREIKDRKSWGMTWRLLGVAWVALVALVRKARVDAATTAAIGDVDNANCALCAGLQYCSVLNGKLLYDPVIGYTRYVGAYCASHSEPKVAEHVSMNMFCREATSQLEKQGVCEDLDAKTLALSQFGDQFQFKDTARCHTLVWTYHCLSLAATTHRRVVNGVAVSCNNAASATSASKPLPPCRSLCVEVADKCVYSHLYRDYLENVCGNVPCVSEEQEAASNGSLKQAPCVQAPWEIVPNTTFSRCSVRNYVPPKALARRLWRETTLSVILSVLVIIYCS